MIRKFRLYNSRQDLFDLTDNKDFISVNPRGLGLGVTNEFHASGASFVTRKRDIDAGELDLTLVIGYMQDNAYSKYTEFVQFLNHSPYVLEYEFDGRVYRRDCILSELSKEELRMGRTLQETLKLEFTSPFYIERTEQTQPYVPIEGKAGKIYEELRYERRIFESVPESYRAGDIWYWQGEDFPGRNLLLATNLPTSMTGTGGYQITANKAYLFSDKEYIRGKRITFSVDISKTSGTTGSRLGSAIGGTWQSLGILNIEDIPVDTPKRYTFTLTVKDSENRGDVYFQTPNKAPWLNGAINLSNPKFEIGNKPTPWSVAPEDLTNGEQSGYFIAKKSNTSFDFNDFEFYNTTLDTQDKTYDYIYDYTYGPELYVEPVEVEFAYTYDYIYDDEEGEGNSFTIDNNSVYMGVADTSPCEITVYGPCVNPHWDIMQGTKVVQSDGYNLTIPEGYRLVVSSHPNRQRAQLIALDGTVSNVYQQQDLSKTNFVRFPVGRSKILFFNYDRVTFKYREEYVVI